MVMSAEQICSPSPVTSAYEWKILEWNKQTNKQTNKQMYLCYPRNILYYLYKGKGSAYFLITLTLILQMI